MAFRVSPDSEVCCCSMLQRVAVYCSGLQCVTICCNVLQCATVCCSVLQCVAVCCSVLQCVAVRSNYFLVVNFWLLVFPPTLGSFVTVCCSVLPCIVVCCDVLRCVAVVLHCVVAVRWCVADNTLQHNCNSTAPQLQHSCNTSATHRIALQHPATQRIADYPHTTIPLVRD